MAGGLLCIASLSQM